MFVRSRDGYWKVLAVLPKVGRVVGGRKGEVGLFPFLNVRLSKADRVRVVSEDTESRAMMVCHVEGTNLMGAVLDYGTAWLDLETGILHRRQHGKTESDGGKERDGESGSSEAGPEE